MVFNDRSKAKLTKVEPNGANPTGRSSFKDYYDACPEIIIRDFIGNVYNFPSNLNGNSGTFAYEKDNKNAFNGKKWDAFPWNAVKQLDNNDYSKKTDTIPRTDWNYNITDGSDLEELLTRGDIPGYTRISGGKWMDNNKSNDNGSTHDYIIADRGAGKDNWGFDQYKKKHIDQFANDLIKSNKNTMLPLISNDCKDKNIRYTNAYCVSACNTSTTDTNVTNNCNLGTEGWCLNDNNRLVNNYTKDINTATDEKCRPFLKNGKFDNTVDDLCKTSDKIGSVWCKDLRSNGSESMKTQLNSYLYGTHCSLDSNINLSQCNEVKEKCNNTTQLLNDTTPYNCKTLVKGLQNDSNIISMTSKLDITKVPDEKKVEMLEFFNKPNTTSVEDALCAISTNSVDPTCQTYLSNNFSGLVKTNIDNPILLMYFNGDAFQNKVGMDYHSSLNIKFRNTNTDKVGFGATKYNLDPKWSAKLYTYITPSTTNDYLFRASVDDKIKVYLNNNLIINTTLTIGKGYSTYISLDSDKGPYLLYIEYFDFGGVGSFDLSYTTKGIVNGRELKNVPDTNFYTINMLPAGSPIYGISTSTTPLPGTIANSLYMSPFNPYTLVANSRQTQSIAYCSKNNRFATDENCKGSNNNNYTGFNSLYTSSDPTFKKSMIDYCAANNNFSTDTFCIGDSTINYINGINKNPISYDVNNTSINTAIDNFCKDGKNNSYDTAGTQWCKKTDNINNTNYKNSNLQALHSSYVDTLRNTRLKYNMDAVATSINKNGALSQDVIDYITTDYPILQQNGGEVLFPNSNIASPDVLSFCEANDPELKTNLCSNIYNNGNYKKGTDVKASQDRINDFSNCISTNAFMGKSIIPNDPNNDICLKKRDAPETYARYLPLATRYCGIDDNIVTPECNTYYNTIQSNINKAMNNSYINSGKSSFANKETFAGDNCDEENCEENCNDKNYAFLFILFICFVLVLCCFTSYSKHNTVSQSQLFPKSQY